MENIVERDYKRDWVNPEGYQYRMKTYERQKAGGVRPLTTNPTINEICDVVNVYNPKLVLEVGCGWGRILENLIEKFNVEGCDVSQDMLRLCSPKLKVFSLDITVVDLSFLSENVGRWDVIFTRGVMLYFKEVPIQMVNAMCNMTILASKKVIVWEWSEVCERMKELFNHPKFEYHPIEHRDE